MDRSAPRRALGGPSASVGGAWPRSPPTAIGASEERGRWALGVRSGGALPGRRGYLWYSARPQYGADAEAPAGGGAGRRARSGGASGPRGGAPFGGGGAASGRAGCFCGVLPRRFSCCGAGHSCPVPENRFTIAGPRRRSLRWASSTYLLDMAASARLDLGAADLALVSRTSGTGHLRARRFSDSDGVAAAAANFCGCDARARCCGIGARFIGGG